ncbi:MAG: invasion associated locus B family protein [Methylotenera sp.]
MKHIIFIFMSFFLTQGYAAEGGRLLSGSQWFIKCSTKANSNTSTCMIERNIYLGPEFKIRLATINIEVSQNKNNVIARFLVPLGVLIPFGLTLDIPKYKTLKLPFIFCDPNGCYSQASLDAEAFKAFLASKNIAIRYNQLQNNNESVNLNLALGDFAGKYAEAHAKLSSAK